MTGVSFTLKWVASEHKGGTKILEYIVEIQEENTKSWRKIGGTRGEILEMPITNLKNQVGYFFRITARNAVGISDPFLPTEKIVAGQRISKFTNHIKYELHHFYAILRLCFNLTKFFRYNIVIKLSQVTIQLFLEPNFSRRQLHNNETLLDN